MRSDAELLAAHVAGDTAAFGELFTRHRDRLWAVALRTMGNRDDAADGLQDGMVAAFRRAASYRGDAAVTTWLHRIVVNACLDRLRAAKVRRTDHLPDDYDERPGRTAASVTPIAPADPVDPAAAAEEGDTRRAVLAALQQLPAGQRAALVLVDMEGYSVTEAARILEVAEGTVKSRCSRGRHELAVLLGMLGPDSDRGEGGEGGEPGNPRPAPPVRPSGDDPREEVPS